MPPMRFWRLKILNLKLCNSSLKSEIVSCARQDSPLLVQSLWKIACQRILGLTRWFFSNFRRKKGSSLRLAPKYISNVKYSLSFGRWVRCLKSLNKNGLKKADVSTTGIAGNFVRFQSVAIIFSGEMSFSLVNWSTKCHFYPEAGSQMRYFAAFIQKAAQLVEAELMHIFSAF